MTTNLKPIASPAVTKPDPHDPYKMRSIEQILSLFDGGAFLADLLEGHRDLQHALLDYRDEHSAKGCKGSMNLKIDYALGKSGDVVMEAHVEFKAPKKPVSSAAAYINQDGELTLYSPMLTRMQHGVRDVEDHDPETGEIRDPN